MERITDEKIFYKKMIFIGVPVVFQNLISIGLNLIDTLMIGMLGEQELAAVGAANQVYFIFTVSLFGLYSGAAVYTAQYWGAQDIDGVRKLLGIDYIVGFLFALIVSVVAYLFAPQIIGLFSQDQEVIGFGVDYIRIACFSYVFSGFSGAISYNSRAIQNLTVPTIINASALCVNAVLNYLLIFGKVGCPQMGVQGAAVATLIARVFELAALLIYVYTRKEHPFKASPAKIFGFGKELFSKVMRTAIPVVFTEGCWAASVALIFAAYGKLGTSALAVAQVANVICEMLQSVYFGVGKCYRHADRRNPWPRQQGCRLSQWEASRQAGMDLKRCHDVIDDRAQQTSGIDLQLQRRNQPSFDYHFNYHGHYDYAENDWLHLCCGNSASRR